MLLSAQGWALWAQAGLEEAQVQSRVWVTAQDQGGSSCQVPAWGGPGEGQGQA